MKPKSATAMAELLFKDVPNDELVVMGQTHMQELAANLTQQLNTYKAGTMHVEAFNPEFSKHSAVCLMLPDMPFIIDTVWIALREQNLGIHHSFHPVIDASKKALSAADSKTKHPISTVWIEFDRCNDAKVMENLTVNIKAAMQQLKAVTADFGKMTAKIGTIEKTFADKSVASCNSFLSWLQQDNFIFLGYRHYDYSQTKTGFNIKVTPKSGLGILRDDKKSSVANSKKVSATGTTLQHYIDAKSPIVISKTPDKAKLHRHVHMDYVGVKEFNNAGKLVGEHRFIGLYTSRVYAAHVRDIPLINTKINSVLAEFKKQDGNRYNVRALTNILETFPRDELFLISQPDLYRIATGIVHLQERQHVRVFIRKSAAEGAVTAFVYLPMARMNSKVRRKIEAILMNAYAGTEADFRVFMDDTSAHARIIYKIKTPDPLGADIKVRDARVEEKIRRAAKGWSDNLRHELIEENGEYDGLKLYNTYEPIFPLAYQDVTPPEVATDDVQTMAIMQELKDIFAVRIHLHEAKDAMTTANIRLFRRENPVSLSEVMPLFECLGLKVTTQNSIPVQIPLGPKFWVHDFNVPLKEGQCLDAKRIAHLTQAISAAWQGDIENDNLNQLVLTGGLNKEEVFILRALSAYAQQVSVKFNKAVVHNTLVKHPVIAMHLAHYFDAKFDTSLNQKDSAQQQNKHKNSIESALKNVSVLVEDQIIQLLLQVVQAALRSNYSSKENHEPLAIKLDSASIKGLPKPTPYREIFVYHNTLEGVHLRGGPVARGGLRHSDRHADFRTEILGLMKAQMTKNTIIVPVGAKGGFVIKESFTAKDRAEYTATVESYYKQFIAALLSLADNIVKGKVIHPTNTIIYDDADPYFVVAADKGTATFSDTANTLAINARNWAPDVGYWLGDAFASGGSQGYDHKKMGITARGAWESVKHHGRQLGIDTQSEDFSVVGIGDMGGDVFGNGMLLSKHICLIGAFNHLHIFVDPEPDSAKSYTERERLFKAGKGWDAYNQKLLSKGGAIFERSAKSLKISPQVQKRFDLNKNTVTPNELMRAILGAKADLFWNGGIGTYIKAKSESDADVADRANDELRLNGADLNCRMVGEGGNLGATQAGRIEYALMGAGGKGGLINTDALDNSAGVDSSDHEVNIKVLLQQALEQDVITTRQRNAQLVKMTDTVAEHVLRNNYLQNQAITLKAARGVKGNDTNYNLQDHLVRRGRLDAQVEGLPDLETLANRKQQHQAGYTRPELSVLMAYAKAEIYDDILASSLPKSAALQPYLKTYFPAELHKKYSDMMPKHRLWREIIATVLTNNVVNRMGMTFVNRMQTETGADIADILAAYLISKHLYEADSLWEEVERLDNVVSADVQFKLLAEIKKLIEYGTFWVLRNFKTLNFGSMVDKYATAFKQINAEFEKALPSDQRTQLHNSISTWCDAGVPDDIAIRFAALGMLDIAPDVAYAAINNKQSLTTVLKTHLALGDALSLPKLHAIAGKLPQEDNWQRIASLAINDSLHSNQRALTLNVLSLPPARSSDRVDVWAQKQEKYLDAYQRQVTALESTEHPTHAMLQALLSQLKGLVR